MHAITLGEKDSLDPSSVGHKAANLARLSASFRVPPAFCLSTSVYDELKPALTPDGDGERLALRECVADAYERLAAQVGVRDPRVAVRSSATGEDGADASFAGQHETILNVSGVDAVIAAIFECWRSAGNERVTAYRSAKGIDAPVHVAVLIQQMVDADVSAIAFGVDPVSGDREAVVIDAALGLGDKIAAGEITPDRYVVRRGDLGVTGPASGALAEAQAREIAKLTLALERESGAPVDVECAFSGGDLYLLQCRPITTLEELPVEWKHPDDAQLHWRRDDAHLGEPVPRLLGDVTLNGPHFGMRARAEYDDMPVVARLEPFCGRSYLTTQRRRADGDLAQLLRGSLERARKRARFWRRVWDDEYIPALRAHYVWFEAFAREAADLPLADVAARWDEVWPRINDVWRMHMFTTGAAYQVMDELAETYERLTGGTSLDALKLVQGRTPALHQLERDMYRLTKLRAGADTAAFERALATFLVAHGNLGHDGEDMRQSAWRDDPASLITELDRRAAAPGEDPDERFARLVVDGAAVEARARETLRDRPDDLAAFDEVLTAARATGPLTEEHNYHLDRQVQTHVGRIFKSVGARMVAEKLLASADELYLLHATEISAALHDARPQHELARARAAEYARWRRLRHPKTLGAPAPASVPTSMARTDLGYIAKQDVAGAIRGVPASSGLRRGRAKLVRSSDDFHKVTKGDVLVCRSSNISWIPLFTIAAAVVTDVGGSLSHAAVVAREFGVPAVVGCGIALATLRDGQMVEVDGEAGLVRPLDG
jgi:pyruvate,water dikinase